MLIECISIWETATLALLFYLQEAALRNIMSCRRPAMNLDIVWDDVGVFCIGETFVLSSFVGLDAAAWPPHYLVGRKL